VLALHGNGGHAEESMRAWRPSIAYARMLAAAASGQWIASGRAVWDDEDRAAREVLARYAVLAPDIDPAHLVVAGFSMGAETGLRLVLAGDLPATGVIALGTAGPRMADPAGWVPLIARERVRSPRICLLVGARDDDGVRADRHRRLADLLAAGGIDTRLEVLPDLGHAYPEDFAPIVRRALAFVDPD
jgi:dienelactone hydrolase